MGILSLATSSLTGSKIYIAFVVILVATAGWGYYEKDRADGYEEQILLYKDQVSSAKTIDEMNKQTARANEVMLNDAIAKQNDMFKKMAEMQEAQGQRVIDQLNKSQAATAQQYNKVSLAIGKIQIQSCEGMVDELISFPTKLETAGSTR